MLLRFWKRRELPVDEFTAMAMLVKAVAEQNPSWTQITIYRTSTGVNYGWK